MFRCHFCQQVSPPKTKKQMVVIKTRAKEYPSRRAESKRRGGGRFRSRDEGPQDAGGKGVETAQEVAACPACAAKHAEVTVEPTPIAPVETESVVEQTEE